MDGKRFLHSIRLQNILSFGPDTPELPLEPLNVLIGPNASGKSNLIEALSLLAAAPRNLQETIRKGGGIHEWLWKGAGQLGTASLAVTVKSPEGSLPLRYLLSFTETDTSFDLQEELLEDQPCTDSNEESFSYYLYKEGKASISAVTEGKKLRSRRRLRGLRRNRSILSQRSDPDTYPELTYLGDQFDVITFYREWDLGPNTLARQPQDVDLEQEYLLEDASNLALVMNYLSNRPGVKRRILDRFQVFNSFVEDIVSSIRGQRVQLYFHETSLRHPLPATRISDGTLRYLCLLAILCHPEPPPVTCIEEPELGLHPDIIPQVAKLLVEASTRTQLFVTTHSDILVDALSHIPESIIVCEKSNGATQLQRLDAQELKPWLEKYRLGDLWTSGHIGGNRW
ncbi:MAG: AAA family ATPase [bacterium]|nr:AAA family ATPase [bacterium]MDE2920571.1 AAA family ATPase [Chloroflexota bacterium]